MVYLMSEDNLRYEEFVALILDQLYANRAKHTKSQGRGLGYMFMIAAEQLGQLGKAIADKNWEKALVETAHVTAILFEVFERVLDRQDKTSETDK